MWRRRSGGSWVIWDRMLGVFVRRIFRYGLICVFVSVCVSVVIDIVF